MDGPGGVQNNIGGAVHLPEIEGDVPVDGPGGVQNNVGGAVHHPDYEKRLHQLHQAISKISLLLNAAESLYKVSAMEYFLELL